NYFKVDGSLAWKWTFTYDEKGNVIEEGFGTPTVYRKWNYAYEYDKQGNWIKRTASQFFLVSGKETPIPEEIVYRTFSYYSELYKSGRSLSIPDETKGYVHGGKALIRVEPEYPMAAKRGRVSGTVIVEATVDLIGDVVSAKAFS